MGRRCSGYLNLLAQETIDLHDASIASVAGAPSGKGLSRPSATLRYRLDWFILALSLLAIVYTEARGVTELVSLGSFSLKIIDPLTPALFLLVGLVLVSKRLPPLVVCVYFAIYAMVMVRGVIANPMLANDGLRRDVMFLALLLWSTTGGWQRLGTARVVKFFTVAAFAISALSILRHAFGYELFADASRTDVEFRIFNDGRTLGPVPVLLLSVAIIVRLTQNQLEDRKNSWRFHFDPITLFFFAVILLSGQRTASLGLAVGMLVVLLNRVRPTMHILLVAALAGLLVLSLLSIELNADFIESGFEGKSGTLTYRTLIWAGFFQDLQNAPIFNVLFGRPLGDLAAFYVRRTLWTGSLHSAYIGSISLVGYIGLAVILVGAGWNLLKAYLNYTTYRRPPAFFTPELKLMLASIFLIFGFSYEWRELSGLMFGVLVSNMPAALPARTLEARANSPDDQPMPLPVPAPADAPDEDPEPYPVPQPEPVAP